MQRREKKEGHREPLESQLSALESKKDGHQIRTESIIQLYESVRTYIDYVKAIRLFIARIPYPWATSLVQ